jgi:hypothetical protein
VKMGVEECVGVLRSEDWEVVRWAGRVRVRSLYRRYEVREVVRFGVV